MPQIIAKNSNIDAIEVDNAVLSCLANYTEILTLLIQDLRIFVVTMVDTT